jgi:methyl-accepting chemotaxis protein
MSAQPTFEGVVPEQQLEPYFKKIHQKADRITTGFMVGLFAAGIVFSFFHKTYLLALLMGGGSIVCYFIVKTLAPASQALRLLSSFLYWNYGIQFLLQMHGIPEMKFVFFIGLTVLLFYEDWKVFILPTLYAVLILSLLYFFSDTPFVETHIENMKDTTLTSFAIQIFAILFYAGLCMRWAILQHGQTRESALAAIMMEQQLHMVEVNISFADNISKGNLKSDYGSDQPDKLGASLLNMRASLTQASQREEQEKFVAVGLARIGELLRLHADNLEMLCDKVIEDVVKYSKANQGFIFVKENAEGKDVLRMMAGRAWERKKYLQKTIELGEGLVGQSALEKQTIFLTKVPNHYVNITSGLGESNPRCILIVPLKSEEEIVGVIELASFRVYEEYEIHFLEKVAESIASTILTTKNNQKNKELLEKSNALTQQMQAQEEEIRQNMEEMHATQEEMHRKNKEIERLLEMANEKEQELQKKLTEIQRIKTAGDVKNAEMITSMKDYGTTLLNILDQLPHKIFVKDNEGKMTIVNTAVAKTHNLSVDELIGKSDFDFVDAATAQEWRNQELQIIRKGSETYVFNETLNGETKTLKTTKMAFYIPHLKQTGLLGIQTDITELQRLKEKTEVVS